MELMNSAGSFHTMDVLVVCHDAVQPTDAAQLRGISALHSRVAMLSRLAVIEETEMGWFL